MIRVTCYEPMGDIVIPNGHSIELEVNSNDDIKNILILDRHDNYIAFFNSAYVKACYELHD